ncbi:unnamed protein product [Anisakis simplex]|uniref:Uncharacterized protein n=1 Tax=Anisakis simplex TaxID=6269 RepID=A0A3P6Q2X2_ANISI|nr:unnamed protein product [Anisakis simplex]
MLSSQMQLLEEVAVCVQMNWLTLLTGKSNVGKASTMIDYVNIEKIKAECMEFLVDQKELRDAVANCDDALALRLSIQSAAYLVEEGK